MSLLAGSHPLHEPGRGIGTLSPHEERVGREPERGALHRTELLLSPALSSLLRREERETKVGGVAKLRPGAKSLKNRTCQGGGRGLGFALFWKALQAAFNAVADEKLI